MHPLYFLQYCLKGILLLHQFKFLLRLPFRPRQPFQPGDFPLQLLALRGGGKLYLCCSRDGLYEVPL